MKKTILAAYIALFITFLPPLLGAQGQRAPEATPRAEETEAVKAAPGAASAAPQPVKAASGESAPEKIRLLVGTETVETDMQEYLVGVVAAEMPASFRSETLKAQAVAARTYAMYCAAGDKHGDADVCTDFACCQAWLDESALRENWGADDDADYEKISSAVAETRGEYLSYDGAPVFAAFHSSSAGSTEDCGAVWNARPYLISVDSPETAADVPDYVSRLECAPLDFRDTVLSACPQADFSGDESGWIGALTLDGSGRVATAALGGAEIKGTELRSLFSLRSTAFTLEYTGGRFVFTGTGNGHGAGRTQYGAEGMAGAGGHATLILAHYYPGTALVR